MRIEKTYQMERQSAILALEDLADTFIRPEHREYTVRGITSGRRIYPSRKLLPTRFRNESGYHAVSGQDIFPKLIKAAREISHENDIGQLLMGHIHGGYSGRFDVGELIQSNLQEGESLSNVIKNYNILASPDLFSGMNRWFFWLSYVSRQLRFAIGDNAKFDESDNKFEQFYDRFFGNIFEKYSKK